MVECLLEVEGFKILKPIYISVVETPYGDYIASVPAANLNASGDDRSEAIYNLQDIVAGTYRLLQKHTKLGPQMEHQKRYLESHLQEVIMSECLREVEGFKILKPIYTSVVKKYGFYHADVPVDGLLAIGDSRDDAISRLQCILGATYRVLSNAANLNKGALEQLKYLRSHIAKFSKDDEIKELRKQVADLQSCVRGPGTDSDVLTAHIEQCPKHPLAAAKKDAQELREALAESHRVNRELSDRLYDTERFHND